MFMNISGFRHGVIAILAFGSVAAGEPAVQGLVPDAARVQSRLAAGGWGKVWTSEAIASWLAAGGASEAEWRRSWASSGQVRFAADRAVRHGGVPAWTLTTAATIGSSIPLPTVIPPMRLRRDGAWMIGGLAERDQPLPEIPDLRDAAGDEDIAVVARLPALRDVLPAEAAVGFASLCTAWKLDQVQLLAVIGGAESLTAAQAALPLHQVDPAALAGLPPDLLAVAALGVDGKVLAAQIPALLRCLGLDPDATAAAVEARTGATLTHLVEAIDGTVVFALAGDPSAPQLICGLPAGAAMDAALLSWLNTAHPEPDESIAAAATATVASAAEQPTAIPAIPGLPLFVRRTADRMWLSTAAHLLSACGPEAAEFPLSEQWPEPTGGTVLLRWEAGVMGPLLSRALPTEGRWAGLRVPLAAAGGPAGHLIVRQDQTGLQVVGRDALTWFAPLGAAALATAPGLATDRIRSIDQAATHRMRRVLQRCISFNKSVSGHWPRDVEDLRTWAKDLTDDDFAAPGRPDITLALRYVPPAAGAPGDQPVLVQDPAGRDGRGGLVGFVDGRIEYRAGMRYWQEAVRLQALPGIREHGVEAGQWATMPKTF